MDFVDVSYQYNNPNQPSAIADWLNFYAIFDAGDRTFALSAPNARIYEITSSEDGTGFILTNVTNEFLMQGSLTILGIAGNATSVGGQLSVQYMFNRKTSYSYPALRQDGKDCFII